MQLISACRAKGQIREHVLIFLQTFTNLKANKLYFLRSSVQLNRNHSSVASLSACERLKRTEKQTSMGRMKVTDGRFGS